MQTFLPVDNFRLSAEILDLRRLNKQIIEAKQIIIANLVARGQYGWQNHPATTMWSRNIPALCVYGLVCTRVWSMRRRGGYKRHACERFFRKTYDKLIEKGWTADFPRWFGGNIHSTHRSQLLGKDFQYYARFNWREDPWELEYEWPEP